MLGCPETGGCLPVGLCAEYSGPRPESETPGAGERKQAEPDACALCADQPAMHQRCCERLGLMVASLRRPCLRCFSALSARQLRAEGFLRENADKQRVEDLPPNSWRLEQIAAIDGALPFSASYRRSAAFRASDGRVLPDGWQAKRATNGQEYYVNADLGVATWESPSDGDARGDMQDGVTRSERAPPEALPDSTMAVLDSLDTSFGEISKACATIMQSLSEARSLTQATVANALAETQELARRCDDGHGQLRNMRASELTTAPDQENLFRGRRRKLNEKCEQLRDRLTKLIAALEDIVGRRVADTSSGTDTPSVTGSPPSQPQQEEPPADLSANEFFAGACARLEANDKAGARQWLLRAARLGHSNAQYRLGKMLQSGAGGPRNRSDAIIWLRRASDSDHADAQFHLGRAYFKGEGGAPKDVARARQLWKEAAAQGHQLALLYLGLLYYRGEGGVDQDFDSALKCLREAADLESPDAAYWLGTMYQKGDGVSRDLDQAFAWYEQAAARGHQRAALALNMSAFQEVFGAECRAELQQHLEDKAHKTHPAQSAVGPLQTDGLPTRVVQLLDEAIVARRENRLSEMMSAIDDCEMACTDANWPHWVVYEALESEGTPEDANEYLAKLRQYCTNALCVTKSVHAVDPTLFLSAAVCWAALNRSMPTAAALVRLYTTHFSDHAANMLCARDDELFSAESLDPTGGSTADGDVATESDRLKDEWRALGTDSPAMEELLDMTGLLSVKRKALEVATTCLRNKQLEERGRIQQCLNFVFVGNPGTGKTTVAKLFARILRDVEARPKNTSEELTGSGAISEGPDKIRRRLKQAEGGVFFLDEAYGLSPKKDPFGKQILEMLMVAAGEGKLSVILAGYKDEIEQELFGANPGMARRFETLVFQDYTEPEFRDMFLALTRRKGWEFEKDVEKVIAARLHRARGSKGFGNAGALNKASELAAARALRRINGGDSTIHLTKRDILGVPPDPQSNDQLASALSDLRDLHGLYKVKEEVQKLLALAQTNYEREMQLLLPYPLSLNAAFVGNPGTGKTTVAEIYARILKECGFLSDGDVVLKGAQDFGSDVIGGAKEKTRQILEQCQGKVLVVDEAYMLDDGRFGKEALDVIVAMVSGNSAADQAVLLLGYRGPMEKMFRDQNPGLARRFARRFEFEDYDDSALRAIMEGAMRKRQVWADKKTRRAMIECLARQRASPNFGNAGAVNTLVSDALLRMQHRRGRRLTINDLGDAVRTDDPATALDGMFKVDHIKTELSQLRAHIEAAQADPHVPQMEISGFVFVGSPGTGKTTVARAFARMLADAGAIANDNLVQTSGSGLQAQYVGQTTEKVRKLMEEAQGGVLFVDEAYALAANRRATFADEAVNTLVELMTADEHRGKTVVIFAGYAEDMDAFLANTNEGLASRVGSNRIVFPDWDTDDVITYLRKKLEHWAVDESVFTALRPGIEELRTRKGWANARDAENIFRDVHRARASRFTPGNLSEPFTVQDVDSALERMLRSRPARSAEERDGSDIELLPPMARFEQPQAPVIEELDEKEEERDEWLKGSSGVEQQEEQDAEKKEMHSSSTVFSDEIQPQDQALVSRLEGALDGMSLEDAANMLQSGELSPRLQELVNAAGRGAGQVRLELQRLQQRIELAMQRRREEELRRQRAEEELRRRREEAEALAKRIQQQQDAARREQLERERREKEAALREAQRKEQERQRRLKTICAVCGRPNCGFRPMSFGV